MLQHMQARKLLYQCSAPDIPMGAVYCGFDPTAPSLHLGNLLSIINLARLHQFGYTPIALVGGATVHLGDPSGKKNERTQLQYTTIQNNTNSIHKQIDTIYSNMVKQQKLQGQLKILNNMDFYSNQNIIEFVAQVGRKFRMNSLLSKEHIKQRLDDPENGLSLTEFFYTVLQSYDFGYLHEHYDCVLQIGGSDQWGNITNGCDFIRKTYKKTAYGLTTPLLVDKSGAKFGKSEGNALWLDPNMTTGNEIRQYIINQPDDIIQDYLLMLTFLTIEQIEQIIKQHKEHPERRLGQEVLANELLKIMHGDSGIVENKNKILFEMDYSTLKEYNVNELDQLINQLDQDIVYQVKYDQSIKLVDLMMLLKFRKSKSEFRRLAESGGLYINDNRVNVQDIDSTIYLEQLLGQKYLIIRFGKKEYKVLCFNK